jgi:hypothetical protein
MQSIPQPAGAAHTRAKPALVGARGAAVWRFVGNGFAIFMAVKPARNRRPSGGPGDGTASTPGVFRLEVVIASTR